MSDSSRPTSPTSGAPQRHVSGSLRDRIAKFENLGAGGNAPAPRPMGAAGSSQQAYARGGLVGNRIPSLDPKSASYVSGGPRRVSERRDMIGNRVASTGNANAAAALAPRSTGGSAGSSAKASSPTSASAAETSRSSSPSTVPSAATASTSALGLGRPGQPSQTTTTQPPPPTKSERAESPTGSAAGSARDSTAGSASVSSSAVSGRDSGSAPTSRTSSPATSPGPIPPQLLVSTLPEPSDAGTMTPSSTRAEAGDQASEMSMPATPVAHNPDLPPPGYDLVPGNLTLAAGPPLAGPKPPPSVSSSLVSQYDPKSEGDESTNLKDVSGVSTPTGTPRQAHKLLDDEVSIAGSATGSVGASSGRGAAVDDVEAKVDALALDDDKDDSAPETPVRAPSDDATSTKPDAVAVDTETPAADAQRTPVRPGTGAADKGEESEGGAATPKSEVVDTASETPSPSGALGAAAAAPAVAAGVGAAAAAVAKSDDKEEAKKEPEVGKPETAPFKVGEVDKVATSAKDNTLPIGEELSEEVTPTGREVAQDTHSAEVTSADKSKEAGAADVTSKSEEVKEPVKGTDAVGEDAKAIKPEDAASEKDDIETPTGDTPVPAVTPSGTKAETAPEPTKEVEADTVVETLADASDSTTDVNDDPPKSDAASDITAIVPNLDSAKPAATDETQSADTSSAAVMPSTPAKSSNAAHGDEPLPSPVARAGSTLVGRDRDVTPVASELGRLSLDEQSEVDREATPVPEPAPEPVDPSQPPPALDDDSDIVSVVGGAASERGDDLHSNRSSMPPARASSELEFSYDELHERFFRDSQAQPGSPSVSYDAGTQASGVGQGIRDADGQGASQGAAAPSQASRQADGGSVGLGLGVGAGDANVTDSSFPHVPATEVGNRRPVQVHVEPSPPGVLSDQPAVTVQAPSPSLGSFRDGQSNGPSEGTSEDTSRAPTPVPPAFPDPPANDISIPGTPGTPGTAARAGGSGQPDTPITPGGVSTSILHSFPPVPDEEHPYVEVHVSPDRASAARGSVTATNTGGIPFPRSASDRSGLGLARGSSQSLHPAPPQRTSSLRAPLTPPSAFNQQLATPPLGATLSPSGSYESVVDQPPGAAPPRRKRNSFTPRSPHLDDEDPGDFEPGEGWVTVNAFEPWRSPSKTG